MQSNLKTVRSNSDVIRTLTAEIDNLAKDNATLEQHKARAQEAADEASEIKAKLEEIASQRARIRGEAFVANTQPNTETLDAAEAELEKRSRKAREDGDAARHALEILGARRASNDERIAKLTAECHERVLELLNQRFETTLDRYVSGLRALVPLVAEADAIQNLRERFGGPRSRRTSSLMPDPAEANVPLPVSMVHVNGNCPPILKPTVDDSKKAHIAIVDEIASLGITL